MLSIKATYGGAERDLPVLTPAVQARLQAWYDNGGFEELVNPEGGIVGTDDDEPRCRVGSVLWPVVGATRFARAVLPIDSYTLGLLRGDLGSLAAEADGTPLLDESGLPLRADATAAVTLSFRDDPSDPAEAARTIDLFLIASRPVSRTTGDPFPTTEPAEDDLWLITLVDQRYYWVHTTGSGLPEWWDASAPDYTWDQVFSALFGRVGSAYALDAVHADYTDPTERWGSKSAQGSSAAFLLDYAAACVGSRIVVVPGQTPAVQRPDTGADATLVAWHAARVADDRFSGGGLLDGDEQLGGLPAAVHATFQDGTEKVVYLATGETGRYVEAWHDCAAWRSSGVKATQVSRWATDWYLWQYAPLDAVYAGFVLPPASGFAGSVEWYHDSVAGYTRVSRPWQGWVNPPDWVPDSFPATLTSVFGGTGYEWSRNVQAKLDLPARGVTGHYAVEVNGRTDLQPGLKVEMFAECFGCGVSFEYNPPAAGCNLTYASATNEYKVDVPSLAGTGLTAVLVGGCYQLRVDAGYLPGSVTLFGCGLVFDGVSTLSVDLTGVVNDPLVWTACGLDLNIGCGLTTDGITGALIVDNASLAGDPTFSALVVVDKTAFGGTCDSLGVDLTSFTTTTESLVTDVSLGFVAGNLRLSVTKTPYTNHFNAAELHINRTVGTPSTFTFDVNPCLFSTCCSGTAPTAGYTYSTTDLTATFSNTSSGGTGTLVYLWAFGDGGTSTTTSPSHTYATAGTYTVVLTVTDECGRTATSSQDVTVTAPAYDCTGFSSVTLYANSTSDNGSNGCIGGNFSNTLMTSTSSTTQEVTVGGGREPSCTDTDCGYSLVVVCVGDGTFNITHTAAYSGPPLATGLTSSGGPPGSGTFLLTHGYPDADANCAGNPQTMTVKVSDYLL